MSEDEREIELYRQHHSERSKYVYFLLAAAASGIALAVRVTADATLQWSLAPLGAAVLSFGGSFLSGCLNLQYVQGILRSNAARLEVLRGVHPLAGQVPWKQQIGAETLKEVIERDVDKAASHYRAQFYLLIIGAILFIVWHVLEIVARSARTEPGWSIVI